MKFIVNEIYFHQVEAENKEEALIKYIEGNYDGFKRKIEITTEESSNA
jgi:hypothetical protein